MGVDQSPGDSVQGQALLPAGPDVLADRSLHDWGLRLITVDLSDKLDRIEPEQREHARTIVREFAQQMTEKYAAGALEHGGNLWDMGNEQLLDNAIEEAIDQVVYLMTIRQNARRFKEYLASRQV